MQTGAKKATSHVTVHLNINGLDLEVFADVTYDVYADAFDYEYHGHKCTHFQGWSVDEDSIEVWQINDVLLDGNEIIAEDHGISHDELKAAIVENIHPIALLYNVV